MITRDRKLVTLALEWLNTQGLQGKETVTQFWDRFFETDAYKKVGWLKKDVQANCTNCGELKRWQKEYGNLQKCNSCGFTNFIDDSE